MLRIWNRDWENKGDGACDDKDDERESLLHGTSNHSAATLVATEAVPSAAGDSFIASVHNSADASVYGADNDVSATERPFKRRRISNHLLNSDYLCNHLPEVPNKGMDIFPPLEDELAKDILDRVQKKNIVVVLPPNRCGFGMFTGLAYVQTAAHFLVSQFFVWAVTAQRARPAVMPQSALLVVDDSSSVKLYVDKLASYGLSVVRPTHLNVWTAHGWKQPLHGDVIIVSSSVLFDSLARKTFAMNQFHALVILETGQANLVPSPHLSKVMKDFYLATDPGSRPRLLAIANTFSGHDQCLLSNNTILEELFCAEICTFSAHPRDSIPDRRQEVVVLYGAPLNTTETNLSKQLHQLDASETIFRRQFDASRHLLAEVGACASDLIWRRALKDIESVSESNYEEDDDPNYVSQTGNSLPRMKLKIREIVKNWSFTMPNLDTSSRGFNVTPKFLRLVQILKACEPYGDTFRGIVFVHRRATALVIVDMLRTLADHVSFLRPYAVVATSSNLSSQMQETFHNFSSGSYNLLVGTKSMEDLDVPGTSVVIWYNLFESQVSYAYSRAMTRRRESHLLYMVERNNQVHRRIISQITQLGPDMRLWMDTLTMDKRSSIPPCALKETVDPYHSDSEDEYGTTSIRDPTSSGSIYIQDATTVIYRFVSQLPSQHRQGPATVPLFEFNEHVQSGGSRRYSCTVLLPIPRVGEIKGPLSSSTTEARRTACFKACAVLFEAGLLDYRFFPLPPSAQAREHSFLHPTLSTSILPTQKEDLNIALKSTGTKRYSRKRPDFWENCSSIHSDTLFPVVTYVAHFGGGSQPHGPMLILTRCPLPSLSSFKLFLSGVSATVRFRKASPFQPSPEQFEDLHMYTLRLCRAIGNKPFTCPRGDMLYFFAPLKTNSSDVWADTADDWDLPVITDCIPWELVNMAARAWVVPLKFDHISALEEDIKDAVIQDRWVEFTRRYDAVRLRRDLTPLSKPTDSPREAGYANFVEYCRARRKGFEGLQDYDQPMIEVSKVSSCFNRLDPTSHDSSCSKPPLKYLIPELCAKFTVPASTLRTAMLLPSIMRRIDEFLIVKELNAKFFDHEISEILLFTAVCTPSAGNEYNYERLELFGDAFLKYLSSIYVFVTNPTQNEGALHYARQQIISNKSLLHHATLVGLPPYIQAKSFAVKLWQPPNFQVDNPLHLPKDDDEADASQTLQDFQNELEPGEIVEDATEIPGVTQVSGDSISKGPKKKRKKQHGQYDQWLGDKAVADVAEAIIGAAYISGGRETALKVSKALNIPIPDIDRWSDFGRKVLAPHPNVTAKLRPGCIEAVQTIIGHQFKYPHLLAQALTHSSIQGHESTSYERLEFIGDAILDFMVIRHIFDRDQQLTPGGLTLLKGAMVSNSALAAVCVWSGLHEHLLFESHHLAKSIHAYADHLKTQQAEEHTIATKEGRSPGQYWLEIEPPKALSDVVESIIGAVYISDNFSPVGAEALFDNVLKPFYDQYITLKTLTHHPTKTLLELLQAHGCQQFEIIKEKKEVTHCHVVVHDVILASADDITAKSDFAARRASLFALDALEGDPEFLLRTCDCRTNAPGKKQQKWRASCSALSGFEDKVNLL